MNLNKAFLTFFILFFTTAGISQIKLCSWNLENFGKSKTDSTINFIANTVKDFDLVAIVEVVAGDGGAQAVARLSDALNRKGNKWDYSISEPTTGSPNKSERYAFLWKTNKIKKADSAWLEGTYKTKIEREPYFSDFIYKEKRFTVAVFHAIPKDKQPEIEIKYFRFLPDLYPTRNVLFCGDFNCPESHTVFNPLKSLSYKPIFTKQKTSLKRECSGASCLASEYDNVFYNFTKIHLIKSGVIHFYKDFNTLKKSADYLRSFTCIC